MNPSMMRAFFFCARVSFNFAMIIPFHKDPCFVRWFKCDCHKPILHRVHVKYLELRQDAMSEMLFRDLSGPTLFIQVVSTLVLLDGSCLIETMDSCAFYPKSTKFLEGSLVQTKLYITRVDFSLNTVCTGFALA